MLLNIFKRIFPCFFLSVHLFASSLEEKVGQLMIVHFNGTETNEEARQLIQEAHVGGFILFNWANGLTSPEQVRNLTTGLQKLTKTPLWICIDQEGGPVKRLQEGFEGFPGNREMVEKYKPEEIDQVATKSAQQLRSLGINMNLAPVVDVSNKISYIAPRTFGDDPDIVVQFAEPIIKAYRKEKVLAVPKHFPGYGTVTIDPHTDLPINHKTIVELFRSDLRPFSRLHPDAIMTAHILLPAVDPKSCATLSKPILQDLLRKDVGFHGLVLSDSLVMEALLKNCETIEEAAIQAVNAGCDLLILGGKQILDSQKGFELTVSDNLRIHQALLNAVKTGRISNERLEEAVQRSLLLKKRYSI